MYRELVITAKYTPSGYFVPASDWLSVHYPLLIKKRKD